MTPFNRPTVFKSSNGLLQLQVQLKLAIVLSHWSSGHGAFFKWVTHKRGNGIQHHCTLHFNFKCCMSSWQGKCLIFHLMWTILLHFGGIASSDHLEYRIRCPF